MKLSEARQHYYDHSGSASASVRQLAFAGIAVIWVFNQPQIGQPMALPSVLVWALLALCLSLASDLLQYSLAAAIWGFFHRLKEKQHASPDADIKAPIWLNWPAIAFFWGKQAFLMVAYILLAIFLVQDLHATP